MDGDGMSLDKDGEFSSGSGDPGVDGQGWAGSPGSSLTPDLKTASVSLDGNEDYLCDDRDKLKQQLDTLVIRAESGNARLQEVETQMASAEAKLRSCNDILGLIYQLKDRIQLMEAEEMLPSNAGASSISGGLQAEGPEPRSTVRVPNSPRRCTKSPIRSPKSPRSH